MTSVHVIVEADGGSRGNPGVAGYGCVVFAADHTTVMAERYEYVGTTTNNVAEYRGLIAGLEAAAACDAATVAVRMDSKLVIEQMTGRWKVKHPDMKGLNAQARELLENFDTVDFQWIPREKNKHADRLANVAMDTLGSSADASSQSEVVGNDVAPTAVIDTSAAMPQQELLDVTVDHAQPDSPTPKTSSVGWLPTTGSPTRLLLLRHGQTPLSVDRRYSGRGNPELTALGREQAERAAHRIASRGGISAIVSSPLARAHTTATAVARRLQIPVTTVDGLTETDFGRWEGLTFTEAARCDPTVHARWLSDTSVPPPDGESFDEVHSRVNAAVTELVESHGPGNIVVVSHVTPIKTILRMALDVGPSVLFRLHLDLASLSIAELYPDGGASVRLVNDTNHLS